MRNRIPRKPPEHGTQEHLPEIDVEAQYVDCRKRKMAPATTTPEQAPMLWTITF